MTHEVFWNALVPELSVTNLEASLRFYSAAGFTLRFRRSDPPFAYLELGNAQLMLEQDSNSTWHIAPLTPPLGRGVNFQIEVADAAALHVRMVLAGMPIFRPPTESWYAVSETLAEGQIEFLLHDPDGYLLRFVQVLGSKSWTSPAQQSQ